MFYFLRLLLNINYKIIVLNKFCGLQNLKKTNYFVYFCSIHCLLLLTATILFSTFIPKVPSHLLPHVYTLAYHLSIENIVHVCAQYLTRLLNVDNCLSIRSFALDENLIEASSECIEKNIEYILQLKPTAISMCSRGSVSSSMSSLVSNSYTKIVDSMDITKSCSTLSSSLNLAHKEFNQLPRIQIELVGLKNHKLKLPDGIDHLTELCMNWLVDEVVKESPTGEKKHELSELCENLVMLYLSNDSTLHDCCKMEQTNLHFDDYIDDYQKRHNSLSIKGKSKTMF